MESVYPHRRIDNLSLPPLGFGAMLLSLEGRPDRATAIRSLHTVLDAGVRLIDTAINYAPSAATLGHNEELVAEALASWSGDASNVLVVCKGGNLRSDVEQYVQDGRPENLRWSCEQSLRSLNVESIGLYFLHAIDPKVPLEESLGALARLQEEGKIQRIGLSNVGRRHLALASQQVTVAAVENQLSPFSVNSLPIVDYCEENAIAFLAYSPLGGQTRAKNWDSKPAFMKVAAERGVSPQRVALAWALSRSPAIIPIPAARRPETILDSLGAANLRLTSEELVELNEGYARKMTE
ncbi:MAG TPA: aldo/keto reductase [Sphingobium sp.]|uniref:aldo/keto reductase n=1 Tax=Sphingobium sp. TaxID=1912891 RepID=UPI002ED2481B